MIGPGPHNKTRQSNQCGYCTYYLDNFFWSVKMVKLVRLLRPGWLGWSVSCQGIGVVSWPDYSNHMVHCRFYPSRECCTTFHSVCVCVSVHQTGPFGRRVSCAGSRPGGSSYYIEEWTRPGQVRSANRIHKEIPCDISPWQVFDILIIWMMSSYWLRECPPRVYSSFTLRDGNKELYF